MNLLRLLSQSKTSILIGLVLALLPAVASALIPVRVVKPIFDQLENSSFDFGKIWLEGLILLVMMVVGGYFHEAWMGWFSVSLPAQIRSKIFNRALLADMSKTGLSPQGISGRILSDLRELESFVFFGLGGFLIHGVSLLAVLYQLFSKYPSLSLQMLLVLPVLMLLLFGLGRFVSGYSYRTQQSLENLSRKVAESFSRLDVIRAMGLEHFATRRLEGSNAKTFQLARGRSLLAALNLPLGQAATTGLIAYLLILGIAQVRTGTISVGDLLAFLTLLALAISPMQILMRSAIHYAQGEGSAKRILELLELPLQTRTGSLKPENFLGSIQLKEVEFEYDALSQALSGVSLEAKPGELTALVGPSGSGKSTIVKLILGLQQTNLGKVLIDDVNINDFDWGWLRERVAWVPQEPLLFGGTIWQNLRAFAPTAHRKDAMLALEQVGLTGEISLDTLLEDEGKGLSVGQRQRVAIAAAILRDAKILVLDEATSALDNISQSEILKILQVLKKTKTIVIVAHRLKTVENADMIYVLQEGKVVESGNPQALSASSGIYSQMKDA